MRISGFTIARNAQKFGYPFLESLRSLLPLVDELVVAVGDSEDDTLEMVRSLPAKKIKVIRTVWDPALRAGGQILSAQTNLALARCSGDWGVYLQADEVLHEDDLGILEQSLKRHHRSPVEGLRMDYLHFYGSYQTVQTHWRKWYRSAVRAVKLGRGIQSVGDAYGFRLGGSQSRRLLSWGSGARVFHYGWSRPPLTMQAKQHNLDRLYHNDQSLELRQKQEAAAMAKMKAFYADRGYLDYFRGSHPAVMAARVMAQDWAFDDGIATQAPAWLRQLDIALAYPLRKRMAKWRVA
jgi:glycosyltransferase involved in cell wall biosynthesis